MTNTGHPRTPSPPVIGLTGPGGVGKSTVARALGIAWATRNPATRDTIEPMPEILHIGAPMKAMLEALLLSAGLSPAEVPFWIDGPGKRKPCPALAGKTPTQAMQALGTEWGRACISPALWLSIWTTRANDARAAGHMVINDSVRFENEAEAIRAMGGLVVRITGRNGDLASDHPSERPVSADLEIQNTEGETGPEQAAAAILSEVLVRLNRG